MNMEFKYVPPGMPSELQSLNLDELCQHYWTHQDCFMTDEYLCTSYFSRFLAEADLTKHQNAIKCFIHMMNKFIQLSPFNPILQNVTAQLYNTAENSVKNKLLAPHNISSDFQSRITHLQQRGKIQKAHDVILAELQSSPASLPLADMLLEMDISSGLPLESWLNNFEVPDLFKKDWQHLLALKHAKYAKFEEALYYWEQIADGADMDRDISCNLMGASYLKTGNKQKAAELFAKSLAIDPSQTPIKLLKAELENPFTIKKDALGDRSIPVCIYSFNKDSFLEMTLHSVCKSSLGKSDIIILLNGCSDNSQNVVEKIKSEYPEVSIELIVMPVNIGAPAARNYLVNRVLTSRNTEYMAFLDDDVELPADWLESLVTAIEEDPKIGAVGCKVLNPQDSSYQYLYRNTSIAKPGIIRLSLSTPLHTTDSGLYDVRRDVDTVMGCCHLIRTECFEKVPGFDIGFSPSQLDDVAFHLDLRLHGYKVRYLGQLSCTHHRSTGFMNAKMHGFNGNSLGNDVKFYYRFLDSFEKIKSWQDNRNSKLS
ncbi:glycosyltransferase [Maridesulfovibrio bastinii]|uniref:glycosyltransferase n=1 Tax=Maridesulfovibrio bastinii TaxID=47157 RepID=UPI000420878E|nr:glycosyltransferase [Maridesulfovibrio bastinii]